MNLANRITIFRFILTPIYCLFFYLGFFGPLASLGTYIALWVIFVLSEFSDLVDGWVARRYNMVTDLGKLMDPFADVIFRITYFFLFSSLGIIPWWTVLIILWREFTILFIRMLLIKDGQALAAGVLGKIKATFYFLTGVTGQVYLVLSNENNFKSLSGEILVYLAMVSALLALISLLRYLQLYVSMRKSHSPGKSS
ncbi:MAG: CDP-diacylglycerol--glycerol-3-phosphate 3-phosphatidyltransferase [Spirochaetaceae bacterium]|jgi:CDP-diacylglycerol--glycerol-3-phosphate 3-phosphatidyltransferase|nr:CDP-diacylglycerol--glycerol-3-phosphate 3-phosphatidyltransferase [Spirochaetaceae bacterium]